MVRDAYPTWLKILSTAMNGMDVHGKRIIIIGGVAAGAKAAAKAHRIDPNHKIILYQDEADVLFRLRSTLCHQ
jgi:hypothetical protein